MGDLVGIDAAAKTIAEALDRNVDKINGFITSIGTIVNTAVDKIDVAVKRNVDNLSTHIDNFAKRIPSISIQISTKEI